jgi:iron complex outermembrane receptor protein
MTHKQILATTVSLAAFASFVAPADAQTVAAAPESRARAGDGLEEVVVTARKVAENNQRVPVAVTAYSGEQLQMQNARTLPDVATLTPSLQFAPAITSAAAVQIQMRGQVQVDTLATIDPSVGVYVDGVYWARAYGLTASLVDVADYQALKGPQGTLFGRNTTGGAILVNTNDPSLTKGFSGSISGTAGRFSQQSATAVLNVPIIDNKVAARLVYSGNSRDGYVREVNSGRMIGDVKDYTFRGKLLLQPTEDLEILVSAEKFHTDTLENPGRLGYFSPNSFAAFEAGLESLGANGCFADQAACVGAGNAILANAAALAKSQYRASLTSVPRSTLNAETYTLTATLGTSIGDIKAIGAYRQVDALITDSDNDASSVAILDSSRLDQYGLYNAQKMEQWSGELTLTGKALGESLDYAVGVFVFDEHGHDDSPSSTLTALGELNTQGPRAINDFLGDIDTESIGVYTQDTYHLNDKLSFTGGIRWSQDHRSLTSHNGTYLLDPNSTTVVGFICGFPVQGCPYSRSATFDGVAYTFSVDYQVTENMLGYVKTAKGFRSGGLQLRAAGAIPGSLGAFDPEIVYSYEGGIKSESFNHRLRVNAAGYYTHATGAQRNTIVTSGNTTTTVTSNAGVVDIYGAELQVTALLGLGFTVDTTASYTHPKYVKFIDYNGFDRSHEPFPMTPRWTATLSPQWTGEIGAGPLSLRADFIYQSKQYNYPQGFYVGSDGANHDAVTGDVTSAADVAGYNAANTDKAHVLINANATLTLLDGMLDLSLWGKNLTNMKDYVNTLPIPQLGFARSMLREPRTYGATATVKF